MYPTKQMKEYLDYDNEYRHFNQEPTKDNWENEFNDVTQSAYNRIIYLLEDEYYLSRPEAVSVANAYYDNKIKYIKFNYRR